MAAYQLADVLPDTPPSHIADNFQRLYVPQADQFLLLHPNGLCLVGLAPAHGALRQEEAGGGAQPNAAAARPPPGIQASIDFAVGRSNLLEAEFKKGRGPLLSPDAALCSVTVGDTTYLLRSHVRGLLVEINKELAGAEGAGLLKLLRHSYVAIISPRQNEVERLRQECASPAQYAELRGLPLAALQ